MTHSVAQDGITNDKDPLGTPVSVPTAEEYALLLDAIGALYNWTCERHRATAEKLGEDHRLTGWRAGERDALRQVRDLLEVSVHCPGERAKRCRNMLNLVEDMRRMGLLI